jgi:hypothetical protein
MSFQDHDADSLDGGNPSGRVQGFLAPGACRMMIVDVT